ncbi:hypothetical protein L1077_10785 [Pseudoalteromonas luteoviolacea]|uniref:hypothetical protein n=1 Tax=Pseudoalteromonas luteoviolacea TaxID=43657 RepID=UPI001F406A7E|nr:hypothetical protein [Pseudoalteromonas luteoviolacea]MCF6439918.1 hypothetical protein [Pseudoalteromonas luteoviolacea]
MKLNIKKSKLKTLSNDNSSLPSKATKAIAGGGIWVSLYNECNVTLTDATKCFTQNITDCTSNYCG